MDRHDRHDRHGKHGTRAGIVAATLALAACACGGEPPPQQVSVEVQRRALQFRSSFYGEIEARKSIAIHTPDLSGINYLTVATVLDDGAEVKKGDVVLTFEKGPVEDNLIGEKTKLAVAKAEMRRVAERLAVERIELELQLERRQMAVQRAKLNLVAGVNLISKLELEKARLDHEKAKLDLKLARRALATFAKKKKSALEVERLKVAAYEEKVKHYQQARDNIALHAPAAGVIFGPYTRLNWVRGKVAPGSVTRPGDRLLELPDLTAFNAVLYIRQRDAALLQVGDAARVIATVRPDHPIKARIVRKEAFATTRNQRFGTDEPAGNLKEIKVVLELDEALDCLRPGGTVRADLSTTLADDALIVPLAAVQTTGRTARVTLADGTERTIKLGKSSTLHAEVLDGLRAGDRVLLTAAAQAPAEAAK